MKDYIDNGFVEILNIRGKIAPQVKAMEDCRKKNFKKFDWLIFYDMDEFIFLRNYSNILDYLSQTIFDKCKIIQLNWFDNTDNNLIYRKSCLITLPLKMKNFKIDDAIIVVDKKAVLE